MAKTKKSRVKSSSELDQQAHEATVPSAPRKITSALLRHPATPIVLITTFMIIAPSLGFMYVSASHEEPKQYLNGFDIRSDCEGEIEALLIANPSFETGNIRMAFAIRDYEKKSGGCSKIQFVIPGVGRGYRMILPTEALPDTPLAAPPQSSRKAISNVRTDPLGYQTVEIDTKTDKEFIGNIEFVWMGGIHQKSFAERKMVIPFTSVQEINTPVPKSVPKSFRVSMTVREGNNLKEKSHEIFGRRSGGGWNFYYFDVNRQNQILELVFEDISKAPWKDRLQNLFAAIFGAGLALVSERLLQSVRSSKRSTRG